MKTSFLLGVRLLKENKKRTLAVILAASLVVSMVTAVWYMVLEGRRILGEINRSEVGQYHVMITEMDEEQLAFLKSYRTVKSVSYEREIGYAQFRGIPKEMEKPYLFIRSVESDAEDIPYVITQGRAPLHGEEIVLPLHLVDMLETPIEIGQTVHLAIGKRQGKGKMRTQEEALFVDDLGRSVEQITQPVERTFEVVGFMKRPSYSLEPYEAPGFTAITAGLDEGAYFTGRGTAYIHYERSGYVNQSTLEIVQQLTGPETEGALGAKGKDSLVDSKGVPFSLYINEEIASDQFFNTYTWYREVVGLGALITVILLVFSFSAIYFTFHVCLQGQLRNFSLLRSMGATLRQIKQVLFCESILLGAIVAVLGIAAGFGGTFVTLELVAPYVNRLLPHNVEIRFAIQPATVLLAALFAFAVMVVSVYIHQFHLKKELVLLGDLFREQYEVPRGKLFEKIGRLTFLPFEAKLALQNLLRNKKVLFRTYFSLFVSSVLIFTLSFTMNQMGSLRGSDLPQAHDLELHIPADYLQSLPLGGKQAGAKPSKKDTEELEEESGSQKRKGNLSAQWQRYLTQMEFYETQMELSENIRKVVGFYGSFDFSYTKYEEGGHETKGQEDLLPTMVRVHLVSDTAYTAMGGGRYGEGFGLASGVIVENKWAFDTIYENMDSPIFIETAPNRTVELVLEERYVSQEYRLQLLQGGLNICVNIDGLRQILGEKAFSVTDPSAMENLFHIDTLRHKKAVADILEMFQDPMGVAVKMEDYNEEKSELQAQKIVIYTFFLGIIGLVLFISLTNVYNTINVSLSGRKREFAVLKSIGLQNRSLKKILGYESVYYVILTMVSTFLCLLVLQLVFVDYAVLFYDGAVPALWLGSLLVLGTFLVLYGAMGYFARGLLKEDFLSDLKQIH